MTTSESCHWMVSSASLYAGQARELVCHLSCLHFRQARLGRPGCLLRSPWVAVPPYNCCTCCCCCCAEKDASQPGYVRCQVLPPAAMHLLMPWQPLYCETDQPQRTWHTCANMHPSLARAPELLRSAELPDAAAMPSLPRPK